MLNATVALFHRRRMASTEDFWKKRQANGAAIDVWLLNRNPGDIGVGGGRQKEQGEQGGVGVGRRKDFTSRSTPALAKPSATSTSQVVMRRPASLLSVEKNSGRGKRS